ncbi:MAG: hypothetical protein V4462_11040, partial [Pseudomonadota bacterium]
GVAAPSGSVLRNTTTPAPSNTSTRASTGSDGIPGGNCVRQHDMALLDTIISRAFSRLTFPFKFNNLDRKIPSPIPSSR